MKYVFFALALLFSQQAVAHEAPSGIKYPPECCGGNDCAPIQEMSMLEDGSLKVRTKHGTAIFPKDFPIRPSFDEQQHACFMTAKGEDGEPYTIRFCLFLSAGS